MILQQRFHPPTVEALLSFEYPWTSEFLSLEAKETPWRPQHQRREWGQEKSYQCVGIFDILHATPHYEGGYGLQNQVYEKKLGLLK